MSSTSNLTSGATMESHLHSLVLSAGLTWAFSIRNVSHHDTVKDRVKVKQRNNVSVCLCQGELTGYPAAGQLGLVLSWVCNKLWEALWSYRGRFLPSRQTQWWACSWNRKPLRPQNCCAGNPAWRTTKQTGNVGFLLSNDRDRDDWRNVRSGGGSK